MLGTLISIAAGTLLLFYKPDMAPVWLWLAIGMVACSLVLLILGVLQQVMAWGPLLKAQQNSAPYVIELYRNDRAIRLTHHLLILFPLLTLFLLAAIQLDLPLTNNQGLAIWLVFLGIACDCLYHNGARIVRYFNPFFIVNKLTETAQKDVAEDKGIDMRACIDALAEVAVKGVDGTSSSLPLTALNEMQVIARNFLNSSKSIAHQIQDKESLETGTDKISYTLFFLYQRLEMIFNQALQRGQETICTGVITCLGKIAFYAAKFDISLATDPIHLIGRLAQHAQSMGMNEVTSKATITLLEVVRIMLNEIDVTYLELKEPFAVLITDLHEIEKETFRQNKQIEIAQLRMPFNKIKELFAQEKLVNHPDTPEIVARANQAIAEFDALELVLKTVPPIPNLEEEEKAQPPKGQGQ